MLPRAVLVTGATGFVGKYVVSELLFERIEVYALTRDLSCGLRNVQGVKLLEGDITSPIRVPPNVSVIYHCAGVITDEARMHAVNIEGTQRVVEAAMSCGCKVVHLSSAGVVGPTRQPLVDEDSPCRPMSLYERTKLDAEKEVLAGVSSGLQATMLRPTTVFGVGRAQERDSFLQLLRSIKSGRYRNIGGGNGIYGIVHAREVARAMIALGRYERQIGDAFFINTPVPFRVFSRIAASAMGCDDCRSMPYPLAVLATVLLHVVSTVFSREMPLTWSRLMALTSPTIYSQDRLVSLIKYRPANSIEHYITQVCNEYGALGSL